jgi:hypothetical protein
MGEDGPRYIKPGLSLPRSNIDYMEPKTTFADTNCVHHMVQVEKSARTNPECEEIAPNNVNEKDRVKLSGGISTPDQVQSAAARYMVQQNFQAKEMPTNQDSNNDELSPQPTKKIKTIKTETSPAGKPLLLTKPVEMRSFTGETLELWNSLHLCDGSGFSWSCTGNSMIGKRYRRVCPTQGRMDGFLVAWAKVGFVRFLVHARYNQCIQITNHKCVSER